VRSDPELVDRRAADSLFTDAGNRPRIGQADRGDARGSRRQAVGFGRSALAGKSAADGIDIPQSPLDQLRSLAG
jgi:hypothetical protein